MTRIDYRTVTETSSTLISQGAHEMMYTRYRWAAAFCEEARVLEIGCGAGQGLPYLAGPASRLVGADVSIDLLREASSLGAADLVALDAARLPFGDATFDVILLFEMIYYLADPEAALEECRRVLARNGTLLIVTANPERPDFNPSPYTFQYLSARDLHNVLHNAGFDGEVRGGFPLDDGGLKQRAIKVVRQLASRFGLIPKTMRGKALLKRLVYGRLSAVSEVRDGVVEFHPPQLVQGDASSFQVLYATGRKTDQVPG